MLPQFSVRKPYTVLVAVVLVLVLGVISFTGMTTDLLPAMELPYVVVMTTYPGASPEKIETTVTKPLEAVLGTTGGIKNVSSVSSENASLVILEFEQGNEHGFRYDRAFVQCGPRFGPDGRCGGDPHADEDQP